MDPKSHYIRFETAMSWDDVGISARFLPRSPPLAGLMLSMKLSSSLKFLRLHCLFEEYHTVGVCLVTSIKIPLLPFFLTTNHQIQHKSIFITNFALSDRLTLRTS
jgi:hypothetical protein